MKTVMRKPEYVQAIRFAGWGSAEAICDELPSLFYVPRGYDHKLRRDNEYDRSNGLLLTMVDDFLVYTSSNGDKLRVNTGMWIIQSPESDELEFYTAESYRQLFDEEEKKDE